MRFLGSIICGFFLACQFSLHGLPLWGEQNADDGSVVVRSLVPKPRPDNALSTPNVGTSAGFERWKAGLQVVGRRAVRPTFLSLSSWLRQHFVLPRSLVRICKFFVVIVVSTVIVVLLAVCGFDRKIVVIVLCFGCEIVAHGLGDADAVVGRRRRKGLPTRFATGVVLVDDHGRQG